MRSENSIVGWRGAVHGVAFLLAVTGTMLVCRASCADDGVQPVPSDTQPPAMTPDDRQPAAYGSGPEAPRSGGLLERSFNYRRQPQPQLQEVGAPAGYARAGGWYGYGFPVQSYRWGYFGAERNYPRVIWHTGYYGDCVRTAYRYGY